MLVVECDHCLDQNDCVREIILNLHTGLKWHTVAWNDITSGLTNYLNLLRQYAKRTDNFSERTEVYICEVHDIGIVREIPVNRAAILLSQQFFKSWTLSFAKKMS